MGRVVGILAPQERPLDDDSEATAETSALPKPALVPGSPEAMAAWHAACHEHSIRTAPLNDCPELTRWGHEAWTVRSLMQATEIGEITVVEYARLQPLASERELRIAEITHELRIGELFALAYADEYPVASDENVPASTGPDPIFAAIERHRIADAACAGLDDGKDKEGYEAAHDAEYEALEAVESTQPTTIAGLFTLARFLDDRLNREAGGQNVVEPTNSGHAFVALINACLNLSETIAPGPDRDWAEWAANNPGFLPFPQRQPTSLLKLEYAIPQEAAYLLELAEAELDRRRQAYVGHRDASVWPRLAADLRRDLRMDALAIVAAPVESKVPADPAGEDPIFAAIQAHADARAAFAETVTPQDTAWVRGRGGDTSAEAMAPANAAYEATNAVETQTWAALFKVRPTTLRGVLALLRHCQAWAPSNDGQPDAPDMEDVFGIIADGLEAIAASPSPEVLGHLLEDDPVFAAIAASQHAETAMAAWDQDPDAYRAKSAGAKEEELMQAQTAARKVVWGTAPKTTAGLRALVEFAKEQAALYAGDDWQEKAAKSEFGDVFLLLAAAIEALHGTSAERDVPVTVDSAATLQFESYIFDMPLRSPQEWAGEFSMHAIAMHIADKTLRMSKPELMAFIRDANRRGDGTDGLMWKALNAASDTFDGWAKFLHLAGTRYLVAGASAAVETETENGGA